MRERSAFAFLVRNTVLLLSLLALAPGSFAQTTVQIGTGTDVPGNTLYSPVYRYTATSATTGSRSNILFTAAEMAAAGIPAGATITAVAFNKTNAANFVTPATHAMLMGNTSNTTLPTSTTWASIQASHTQVFSSNSFNIPLAAGWVTWNITPFVYTGGSLEIATETSMVGNGGATDGFKWEYTASVPPDMIVGVSTATGATLSGTVAAYKHRPNIQITYSVSTVCTSPPTAGTTTANPALVCAGDPVNISLTGNSFGVGQTFQLQTSATQAGTYTNVGTSQSSSTFSINPITSAWYRVEVVCSGNTAYSTPVEVTASSQLAGNYTINFANPTGGTNFQTFSDAVAALSCGISAPVVFDVAPGTYTEQISIPQVAGTSPTNTITINGNDAVLQFTPITSARHVIQLNGTDHITIRNLNIQTQAGSTFGWGVHLTNGADNNIIDSCTIDISAVTSTTQSNSAAIVGSGSATSVTTDGSASNNQFTNNLLIGAYQGIILNGGTGAVNSYGNLIANNEIRDFLVNGIELADADSNTVRNNNIHRTGRTDVGTTASAGIELNAGTRKTVVYGNRIHDTHTAATTMSGTFYGLFSNANDAPPGEHNSYINNLLYNFNSLTGIQYGLYNSSSNGVRYYHNTVVLDHAASTDGNTRGFYQTTTASDIILSNNLFYITRNGNGTKHALYFNTAASVISSDYNNLYVNAPGSTVGIGSLGTTNYASLLAWQGAGTDDPNSTSADPIFANAASGNFIPTNVAVNNTGTNLGVTADIDGTVRNVATPDVGAYEFTPGGCAVPPTPGTTTANSPVCFSVAVQMGLTGNSFGLGQTYQWQTATALAGPYTNIGNVLTQPDTVVNASTTLYYRVAVTCGGNTQYSTPVLLTVLPALPAGTYTINSAVPTGAGNYQSFNDAVTAMSCGIAGPVVFNVAPGSGPYNEQVIIPQILGTSAVNTVTFNGNGQTLTYLSTNTNERATIKLNGADHVTFDSLVIIAQGAATSEYGFGVQLLNDADSNRINNCDIFINTSSTSTNFAGIVISNSATSATTTGANSCDGNQFSDNSIQGGYYGITVVGLATGLADLILNNKVTGNTVQDFYTYGIYVNGTYNTLIEHNDISRPARATSGTSVYGIYLTAVSMKASISKNRIHNLFGGNTGTASDAYGIYFTAVDAFFPDHNMVTNNVIYDMNGEGAIYGIYNSGSDAAWYFHNTISLDNTASNSTEVTRGIYQTTQALSLDYRNNLVTVTRGGSGTRHAIFMNTAATTLNSNYNNFYVAGGPNYFIGYTGGDQPTLADWQTASSQDANSLSTNPLYTSLGAGNLVPMSGVLDNKGQFVNITTDIQNTTRSTTTPDIGAYEFTIPVCVTPPTAGASVASPASGICMGTQVQLSLSGNSIGVGQTYQWEYATSASGPWTPLGGVSLVPDTLIQAMATLYYRAAITCSGNTQYSTPVQVILGAQPLNGVYTIDPSISVVFPANNNFSSFSTAVAALNCGGVTGPVIFNTAAGTYTEQIRIGYVYGTSAVNRVTFQSANNNAASVTLTFGATTAADNYVLKLDSASYITFRDLTITATGTTNGRAVEFTTVASYDSLYRNIISAPAVTSTNTNLAVIFGTALSGNDNSITGNAIANGSSGIYLAGTSATIPTLRNVIDSNTVTGSYQYGIYASFNGFVKVQRNLVSRAAPVNTTSYGIYLTNCDSLYDVAGNEVDLSDLSGTQYGIYLTGCNGAFNQLGRVANNKITTSIPNTGTLYGIYQTTSTFNNTVNNAISINTSGASSYGLYATGGGSVNFYNNSVHSTATSATNNHAAYFNLTSSASGIYEIRNNIFSHGGGGRAMWVNSPDNIYSDYNMHYTNGSVLIQWGTGNQYTTLQQWRDTSSWDLNSIVYQPAFTSNSDLQPNIAAPDVWAIHGRGEQIPGNDYDINNNPRPVTLTAGVPDLGAYEFVPTSIPPVLPATPVNPTPGTTQTFMFGTDTVTKITWAPSSTVPTIVELRRYSGVIPPNLATGQQHMYFYTDADITGSTPTNFTVQQYYIDPWQGFIPSQPMIKLGRTDASNNWIVSATSSVDTWNNIITESSLSFLDKFTGLTDGVVPPPPVYVQDADSSNKGRNFWVAYGHHQFFGSGNSQQMVIYLSAEQAANVTIRVNGTNWVRNYQVPANSVTVSDPMPKAGFNDARLMVEGLSGKGISISSDVPIVAYAHIYAGLTSGATMLLPTGTYGYDYRALGTSQAYPSSLGSSYSWINVIADADSTVVEITPSAPTVGGHAPNVPFTVTLNRGEVYQVLGALITAASGHDLTGSRIRSVPNSAGKCYPIAVFSGSSRTALCNEFGGDNLIQQVFPSTAWSTKYLTAPTVSTTNTSSYNANIYRVAVKDPTTNVTLNGTLLTNLINNYYYEFISNTPSLIEADKPVMVAQIMPSQGAQAALCPGVSYTGLVDPELIYISPIDQAIDKIVFYSTPNAAVSSHYVNIIIPTAGVASLTIDGSTTFDVNQPHPQLAGYSIIVKKLAAGQHIAQSSVPFTAIAYGAASEESYGYNAGTLVKNLNAIPSITNTLNTSGNTNDYTCVGTPFRLSILLPIQPTSLVWGFSHVPGISPNTDVSQSNPVNTGTVIINGRTYYKYELSQNYTFSGTGTYNIPISITHPDLEGCSNTLERALTVNVIPAPVATIAKVFAGCAGGTAQFNGSGSTSNGVPINSYNWTFHDNTTAASQNTTYQYNTAGTYPVTLQVVANDGCIGGATDIIIVNQGPSVVLVEDTVSVCTGNDATWNVQNPVAGVVYSWYTTATGGTPVATGASFTTTNVTGTISFWVESDQNGCISTVRTEAVATVQPTLTAPVLSIDSLGTNLIRWTWTAIPGATSYEVSTNGGGSWSTPSSGANGLTHTISNLLPLQEVTLIVRANGGCMVVQSGPVTGKTLPDDIFIPNSFTPNGDGLNDVLRVYGYTIRNMQFMIFNQWGEKIFETRSQATGWDGTHKGKGQPSGVYMYVCKMILNDGTEVTRKGSINLVR